ncbi:DUF3450 family protein [Pseudoalteromonas spongiae]|uniref:DUF3450 family protein n=1 Tax=Pseudoalteromonas spongiae TaxID=298657 RepID=A0ABU8EWQ8_9GAMM
MKHVFVFVMTALSSAVLHAQSSDAELMQQWLDLESQKGKLQLNWQANEQALKNQLSLLKQEKKALNALLKTANAARSEVDTKRVALTEQQVAFEKNQQTIDTALKNAYLFVKRITPLLPPPIQTDWHNKTTQIEQTELPNSEKLERLLSMYKAADEFNQRLAIHNTSMRIPLDDDESERLVNQIYLGLSQAWYISNDGEFFGLGRVEQTGWQWHHGEAAKQLISNLNDADLPSDLLAIKAMLEKPTNAAFVKAPLAIASIDKERL